MKLVPRKNAIIICLVAFMLGGFSTLVLIVMQGMSFGPEGFPLNPEAARSDTERVARLAPIPRQTSELSMTSRGGPFGNQFQLAFFGEIDEIASWVKSCPGIQDPKCESRRTENGAIHYDIPQRPLASNPITELIHHPDRGTVIVRLSY
jgi:hypothetical protein